MFGGYERRTPLEASGTLAEPPSVEARFETITRGDDQVFNWGLAGVSGTSVSSILNLGMAATSQAINTNSFQQSPV
jgi:hypothetical protein